MYSDYEDELAEARKELADKEKLSRKDEVDYLENTQEILQEKDKSGQEKIGKQNKEYENFADKVSNLNSASSKKNTKRTLKNSDEYTKVEENKKQKSDNNYNELAKIFPEGITQKVYEKKNDFGEITSVTVRRIVVKNNKGNDYLHRKTKSGNYYFKNGKSISEGTWDIETSGKIIN